MLRNGSGLPRQYSQHPHDEVAKLLQVGEQEIGSHVVVDLPVLAEEARLELDVCLDVVHQRRITKTQHAAQMALRDCGADRTWRRTDHTRRLAREGVLTPGPTRPVDRVLQPARNRAIELRRHEQHGIDIGNRLLKRPRDRWIVGVVVLAVQWQILDRYLGKFELWWRDAYQRLGEHAVDRSTRKAANEIADFVLGHEYLHSTGGSCCFALGARITHRLKGFKVHGSPARNVLGVRFWPKADIRSCISHGRFRG